MLIHRQQYGIAFAIPNPHWMAVTPTRPAAAPAWSGVDTVRQAGRKLTGAKRLLRIYGSEVVLGRLTGNGKRARLHLTELWPRSNEQDSPSI